MSEWIDVKERLPEPMERVLVWNNGYAQLADYRPASEEYRWDCDTFGLRAEKVTYWSRIYPPFPANLQDTAEPVKHDPK